MKAYIWLAVCASTFVCAAEHEAEVGIGLNRDNASGRGGYADVTLTIANHHKLGFSHQGNRAEYDFQSPCTLQYAAALLRNGSRRPMQEALAVFPEETLETRSQYDAWSYRYVGDSVGGGMSGNRYDGGDGLLSKEFALNVYWQGSHWDLALDASGSDNTIGLEGKRYNGVLSNPQCVSTILEQSFSRNGIGVTIGYTSDGGVRSYLSSMSYDSDYTFPENISYETLLLRTVNAGSLSTALTKNRVSVGVQFPVGTWWFSVDTGREQTLVDESVTRFTTLWAVFPISEQWELEFNVGSTHIDLGDEAQSDAAEKLRTMGAGMRWYW